MIKKLALIGLVLTAIVFLPSQTPAQEGQDVKTEEVTPVQEGQDVKTEDVMPVQDGQDVNTEDVKPVQDAQDINTEKIKGEKEETPASGVLMGSITIGGTLLDLNNKSAKHGEYTGIDNDRFYLSGDADLSYNRDASYVDLRIKDLGLDNREIYVEGGRYDKYSLFLEYNQTPHLISNNSKTPFDGAGSENLTLPTDFVRGYQTQGMSTLNNSLKGIDLKLNRNSGVAGFSIALGRDLDLKISFKREGKNGEKSIGGTIGAFKANARAVVLPEPVDYTADELRAQLAYTGEKAQVQLGYLLSSFDNKKKSITWQNPFDVVDGPTAARISLPPDNRYQKFSLSGGVNFPYFTRVSAIAEYGKMEQNETLLPYSNNPASVITASPPRETADAKIDVTHFSLNVSSRPIPRIGLNARYKYYKTDNKTPRDLFQYVANDTGGTSQASIDNSWAIYNLPVDYTQSQLRLDGSYSLTKGSTFKLGYDHDVIDRNYREVKETKEDTYKAGLVMRPLSGAFASIDYLRSSRKIYGGYDESRVFDSRHTDGYTNTIINPERRFDNNPDLRMSDVADRDRDKYVAKLSFFGLQNTSAGLTYSSWKDDYTGSILGLTESKNNTITVDVSFSPAESILMTAFYTREDLTFMQTGRDFVGAIQQQYKDASRDWSADHRNGIDTAGIGANLLLMKDKLTINADYSYSQSNEAIGFTTGSALNVPLGLPDLKTNLNKIKVSGKYNIDKNLSLGLGYEFEEYSSYNWATDGVNPGSTTMAEALTLSGSVPDYRAHLGMMYLTYNFGS